VSDRALLEELEKVAKVFNYTEFSRNKYNKIANISSSTIERHLGSWSSALKKLKEYLRSKGIVLSPHLHRGFTYSKKMLFDEMERIWQKVGQRPSRDEWLMANAKISSHTYERRFGGWTNACLKFIEYKMGRSIDETDFNNNTETKKFSVKNKGKDYEIRGSRNISTSIRLRVIERDKFRCVFCGKSPATDLGTKLHIDHIQPFSRGGKSVLGNLQTLCNECNLGKSDREDVKTPIHL
ncbi:MAG: HNH endonuclease, partial [Parcubacteria group bacterium]